MGGQRFLGGHFDRPTLARKHWVLSFEELVAAGLSKRQVLRRESEGVLTRIHHGVYAVGRPDLSFEGRCRAAVLACGPGSAVSHGPAGMVWAFRTWSGPIHVTGPRSLEGHPGLVVHRPRTLPAEDVTTRRGLSVTSVARSVLDLSPKQPVERIGRWIHEAMVQGVFSRDEAWQVLQRHPCHRGATRFEAALALEFAPTRSGLEDAFLPIVFEAGLPRPLVNSEQWSGVAQEEVDFCWPGLGLIVETDGGRYHASRWRRRRDAAKDERFRARGWTVWRVPELAITLDRAAVVGHLAELGRSKAPQRLL